MRKLSLKMFGIIMLCSATVLFFCAGIFIWATVPTLKQNAKDELLWMVRGYSNEMGQEFQAIKAQVGEMVAFVEDSIDFERLKTDKDYLAEYEPMLDQYVNKFATERALGRSGWVYFDPKWSNDPHDVYYTSKESGSVPPVRQEHIPFSYYDGIATDTDDKYWWYGPKETGEGIWTNPYEWKLIDGSVKKVVSYAMPIYMNGEFIGVAGTYYPFEAMFETVRNIKVYQSGYASMFNEELGTVIHPTFFAGTRNTSDNLRTVKDGHYAQLAEEISENKYGCNWVEVGDNVQIYAYSSLPNGWTLCLTPVKEEMYDAIYKVYGMFFVALLACVALALLGARYWGNRIARPIEHLTNAVIRFGKGDQTVHVKIDTKDEISVLGDAFHTMTDNLIALQEELTKQAFYDELTGVATICKFKQDAKIILENNQEKQFVIVKVDISEFKLYNAQHGFEAGDNVLKVMATIAKEGLNSQYELIGRVTADEFVLLIHEDDQNKLAVRIARVDEKRKSCREGQVDKIVMPIGCYSIEKGETDIISIMEKVNVAHRTAKGMRGRKLCEYDDAFREKAARRHEIEDIQEWALENGEFEMYLQPKYALDKEIIVGAEALSRWKSSKFGMLSPVEFIPIFEENGFVLRLDMYILECACKTIREWIGHGYEPISVSVNFARLHFGEPDFISRICQVVNQYDIPHELIEVELTETAIFEQGDKIQEIVDKLHQHHFKVSMDDFGTGYSSLGLLKSVAVDVIKLDRSFFTNATSKERERIVIKSMIDMARELKIITVAEGVEEQAHIDFLREMGCHIVQGYYFAKPMPADEINQLLRRKS